MGPVPIEAGLIVDARAEDSRTSRERMKRRPRADRRLSGVVGWQASPDLPSGSESGSRRSRNTRDLERDGKDRSVRDDAAWESDLHYDGGEATKRAGAEKVAGTGDDDLYLTQRSGKGADPDSFVYAIPVDDDGLYRVRLHFAETSAGADGEAQGKKGDRVFDVEAEGETAIEGFDIAAEVRVDDRGRQDVRHRGRRRHAGAGVRWA
jgi:hypothetical protein